MDVEEDVDLWCGLNVIIINNAQGHRWKNRDKAVSAQTGETVAALRRKRKKATQAGKEHWAIQNQLRKDNRKARRDRTCLTDEPQYVNARARFIHTMTTRD